MITSRHPRLPLALDVASHWFQMKAAGQMHHKSSSRNFVVAFYYSNYAFFGYCCCGAEFYYVAKYIIYFAAPAGESYAPALQALALYGLLPGCAIKQFVNVCQLGAAAAAIAAGDAAEANKRK